MTDDYSDDFDYDGHGLVQNLISDTEEDDGVGIGFSLDACRLGGYNKMCHVLVIFDRRAEEGARAQNAA